MLIKNTETLKLETAIPYLEGVVSLGERLAIVSFDGKRQESDIFIYDKDRTVVKKFTYPGEISSFGTINKLEILFLAP